MFGVTRSRYQGRVEAGGSPQGTRSVKADQKHGAPPAASTQPERSPGLYMAAVAAVRAGNPAVAGFYGRLRTAGKPAKVALTACVRKLVVTLNAMLRTGTAWKPA